MKQVLNRMGLNQAFAVGEIKYFIFSLQSLVLFCKSHIYYTNHFTVSPAEIPYCSIVKIK